MRSICRVSIVLFIMCSFLVVNAQEQKATSVVKSEENVAQKAQNNNTVRSNRTESKATIDQSTQNDNSGAANAKKGYDYYQAKSDMNSTKSQTNAQDHNSSRSNKTSQKGEKDDESGTENKAFNQNSSRSNNPQPKR